MEQEQKETIWNRIHYVAALIISALSLFLLYAQSFIENFTVNQTTVLLLTIAALPWLSLFFKKGKIGDIEWDNAGKTQGSVKKITSPRITPLQEKSTKETEAINREFTKESEKILRTLWRYQKATFKDDFSKRWTFAINPASTEYTNYLNGLAPLVAQGLVAVSPENNQCMLSNEGILYVEKNDNLQTGAEYYYF